MTKLQEFLLEGEQILYQPQKDIGAYLWFAASMVIYIVTWGLFAFIFAFAVTTNTSCLLLTLILSCFFLFFSYLLVCLSYNFFFVRLYITDKRIILRRLISQTFNEIKFKDVKYSYYINSLTLVIRCIDQTHQYMRFEKNPQILVNKINELCPSAKLSDNAKFYQSNRKILSFISNLGINVPYIALYFLLVFNAHYMTAYYYKNQGDYNYVQAMDGKGDYKISMINAVKYYKKSIKYDPQNVFTYLGLSNSYRKLKQYDKSIEILKSLLNMDFENPGLIYKELGITYELNKKDDLAIESFKKSLNLSPFHADPFLNKHLIALYKKKGVKNIPAQYNIKVISALKNN